MRLTNLLLPALLLALPIAAHADDVFTFTSGPEVGSFSISSPSQVTVDGTGDLLVTFSNGTNSFAGETSITFYSSADGGGYADDNSLPFQGYAGASVVSGSSFVPGPYAFTEYAPLASGTPNEDLTVSVTSTPEPSSLVLLGTGVLGLAGAVRRRLTK